MSLNWRAGLVLVRVGHTTDRVTQGKTYLTQKMQEFRRGKRPKWKTKIIDDNGKQFRPAVCPGYWVEFKNKIEETKMRKYQPEKPAQPLDDWAKSKAFISNLREHVDHAEVEIEELVKAFEQENEIQKAGLSKAINKLHETHNRKLNHRERSLAARRITILDERNKLAEILDKFEKQLGEKDG